VTTIGEVALADAHEERRFGGKAVQLGAALRAELPVPDGFAFDHDARAWMTASANEAVRTALGAMLERLGGLVAVRSSAVGEDSAGASFAGQHATVLGVRSIDGLLAAAREVHASGHTEAAIGYRKKLGLDPEPRMGVVVQRLVRADVAGVLFTRDPITGEDVRVIEASWGLGECVVQGLVTPDRFRIARGGRILAREAGEKDLLIRWCEDDEAGGTEEVVVEGDRISALCLDDAQLADLDVLASRCEAVFGGAQDLEIAFAGGRLHLLQRRAITRG
jgi:pyruvate, water dikinase